jgi:hypothetical protein
MAESKIDVLLTLYKIEKRRNKIIYNTTSSDKKPWKRVPALGYAATKYPS